mmetsp:Transcript_43408/g.74078  ORF Transcript_43408/g.74078 Transcript_43408/m.74078 type:complete len:431 (+) Transcript_43408:115-1407(+)
MMHKLLALTALSATTASAKKFSPEMKEGLSTMQRNGIEANSSFGRQLINKSRRVEQGEYFEKDITFVSGYSIKFIGCHHVTQWASEQEQEEMEDNNNAEDEGEMLMNAANGRIRSKGLVRFRLCPSNACFDHFGMGCSSNYGEYIVDMHAFLEVYIAWQMEEAATKCETYRNTCFTECYESTASNCYSKCYKKYGVNAALCSNNNNNNYDAYSNQDAYYSSGGQEFELDDYLNCAEYEVYQNDENADEVAHYLGPYCASQGGDIRLGFFQDEYCSIPSSYQANYFEKLTGVEVPYTKTSIIDSSCMTCQQTEDQEAANGNDYYNYDADGNGNYYYAKEVNEMCTTMYLQSGKCESEFDEEDVPYPEEGACTYIESVKRLKSDGIIRSDQTISSKPASIAIGVFTGIAVLLGGYVYYLKTKLDRAKINLSE